MNKTTYVQYLDHLVESSLYKAGAVNKPYKAIKRTDEYKKFESSFEDALSDQGKWIANNFTKLADSAGIDQDSELGLEQLQKLRGLYSRDMPMLDTYITQFKIFSGLKDFFEWSVKQQYKRWGYMVKASVPFDLTNPYYINVLQDRANYLLNKSSLDETTLDRLIAVVSDSKLDGQTNNEVAATLEATFDDMSKSRSEMIARTESANAIGDANHAAAKENGATTHLWVAAGDDPDELCQANEDAGEIPINEEFPSGDMNEPAHPNCECFTQAGEINLDSIDVWTGE